MNNVTKLISLVSLLAILVPCALYFGGMIGHDTVKTLALAGTITWFVATPLWMSREVSVDASEVEI